MNDEESRDPGSREEPCTDRVLDRAAAAAHPADGDAEAPTELDRTVRVDGAAGGSVASHMRPPHERLRVSRHNYRALGAGTRDVPDPGVPSELPPRP